MKAMILAAGLGTRLGDIRRHTPKVLLEVNGKTVLERILIKLAAHGFNDIIINVHHMAEKIIKAINELQESIDVEISISDETDELLETGGGLYRVRDFFDDEPFLLYNGDILSDLDLGKMYDYHIRKEALATIAVRNREGNRAYLIDDNGIIRGWTNRKSGVDIIIEQAMNLSEIPSMAISVYNREIFDYMEEGKYTMTSIILKATATGRVIAYRHDRGYWVDIGTPDQLEKARQIL
ncbi:MAG: nucleotidyltransferase family protein [Bacteroidota bacterium]|nr:nucleotidyltransferase family protein [Bacteroidota bacterium]